MKKLILLLFIPLFSFSQNYKGLLEYNENGYKYIIFNKPLTESKQTDKYDLALYYSGEVRKLGIIPISEKDLEYFKENRNICELLIADIEYEPGKANSDENIADGYKPYISHKVTMSFYNCRKELVFKSWASAGATTFGSSKRDIQKAGQKILKYVTDKGDYYFDETKTPSLPDFSIINFEEIDQDLDGSSEISIKEYFDSNDYDFIEGIWGNNNPRGIEKYLILDMKKINPSSEVDYSISTIGNYGIYKSGNVRGTLKKTASESTLIINFWSDDKLELLEGLANVESADIIKSLLNNNSDKTFFRIYPNKQKDDVKISREEAIKKLKESKELLDLGILTQDEYDEISKELKPIIMNTSGSSVSRDNSSSTGLNKTTISESNSSVVNLKNNGLNKRTVFRSDGTEYIAPKTENHQQMARDRISNKKGYGDGMSDIRRTKEERIAEDYARRANQVPIPKNITSKPISSANDSKNSQNSDDLSYCDGYKAGWKKAQEKVGCFGGIALCGLPSVGRNNYESGFGEGYAAAKAKCQD